MWRRLSLCKGSADLEQLVQQSHCPWLSHPSLFHNHFPFTGFISVNEQDSGAVHYFLLPNPNVDPELRRLTQLCDNQIRELITKS